MKGTPTAAAISLSLPAVSSAISLDSTTHGPAIKNRGRSRPTSKPQSFMSRDALDLGRLRNRVGPLALAKIHGCADDSGWPSRGVEVNSGWNWQPTNQGWSGSSIISGRFSLGVRAETL